MKKISRIATGIAVALVPVFVNSGVAAAATCQIGYTGPNSNNECTLTSTYTCSVTNNNNFDIRNSNDQVVASGTASNSGNTTGGNATTGSATNSNGTSINVNINNSGSTRLCTVVSTVPATPSTPPTPSNPSPVTPSGGMGSVKVPVSAPQKVMPSALPNTNRSQLLPAFSVLIGLAVAAILGIRTAVAVRSHLNS